MSDQYLKPRPEALKRIDHIVILMLENRSFDNLLGWLYEDKGPPHSQDFNGLHRTLWNPLDNVDTDGVAFTEKVSVRKNGGPAWQQGRVKKCDLPVDYRLPNPDPGEGFKDTNQQLFGRYDVPDLYPPQPLNQGFVNNYANAMLYGTYSFGDAPTDPREIMTCYTPEQVPVLSKLAKEFAVCDEWHCSVPSQTLPNRDFVHAATSSGQVNNKPQALCDATTIFNRIEDVSSRRKDENLSWRIYSGTKDGKLFSLTRTIMTQLHDYSMNDRFVPIEQFKKDAKSGNLASYSFLEPQFSKPGQNDQHPNADIRPGEKLIAEIYNAVKASPAWEKTLLVITYDEHGGCYDHVPPPAHATHPDGDEGAAGQMGFRFNRFGVRVPAVLVSPWIERGTVARPAGWTPFDHTSVIATVRNRFDLGDPLTQRDGAAPDLSCVLTLDTPREDKPSVKALSLEDGPGASTNDLQRHIAEVLAKLRGVDAPDEKELGDFIHDAYEKHFSQPAKK